MVAGDQVVRSKESVRAPLAFQRQRNVGLRLLAAHQIQSVSLGGQQSLQPDIDLDVSIRAPSAPMAGSRSRSCARARARVYGEGESGRERSG